MDKSIVYYGNPCYPDKDASAHRTIGNGKALRELGYEVIFIGCRKDEKRNLIETREQFEGFNIFHFCEPVSFNQWKEYLVDFKPLKELMSHKKIDAVILYNHPSISSIRIMNYCHAKGVKVYADCTEWYDPKGFSLHTGIKKIDTWYRMRHVNKKLDGIIAISSYLQRYYEKYGCNTICVPPLIDLSVEKWKKVDIYDSTLDNCIRLIYVGSPGAGTKDKLGLIISSLKKVKLSNPELNFELKIIGMNEIQFQEVFGEDVSGCKYVQFLGRKPNKEALEFIKKSDFTIFLRDNNLICTAGFPTKFSESIACGTPVLSNLTSDIGRYMKDGENGYIIDTTSFETTCDTLYRALCTPKDKINDMKNYCRNDKSFDFHSFIDEFKNMF